MTYTTRCQHERQLKDESPRTPKRFLLSKNTKTGVSLNFPVSMTCQGRTPVCSSLCYASRLPSHIAMPKALKKAWTTYFFFLDNDVDVVGQRIYDDYQTYKRRLGLQYLRWNAVGDLFPKSVKVINYMSKMYDIQHLVFSRKPKMINLLEDSDKIKAIYSIDESSWQTWTQITRPGVGLGYLRTSDFVPPVPITTIFRAHKQWKEFKDEPNDCPCDAHLIPHQHACIDCKQCSQGRAPCHSNAFSQSAPMLQGAC